MNGGLSKCVDCGRGICICDKVAKELENENEKYNLPCPYNKKVMCIQMPSAPEDDNYCDDGCPVREGNEK